MEIIHKSKIENDKYTKYIYQAFDIQNQEETLVTIPVNLGAAKEFPWNIGVIFGGSGKSSILNKMGGVRDIVFSKEKSLISNFDWLWKTS